MTKQLKEIAIPFGAKDSELCGWEYTIPEGMEATIVDNKIVVKKKDSGDGRIRKALLNEFIHLQSKGYKFAGLEGEEIVAWLEKQGEQKTLFNNTLEDSWHKLHDALHKVPELEKQGEQKPTEYTLKQAACIFLDALSNTPYNNKPITDAQAITKELLKFLADTSSYNPNAINEPKHAWSEEDYNEIETIACHLDNIGNEGMAEVLRNIRDKYYHIIPQNTWKPSKEQIMALRWVLNHMSYDSHKEEISGLLDKIKEL